MNTNNRFGVKGILKRTTELLEPMPVKTSITKVYHINPAWKKIEKNTFLRLQFLRNKNVTLLSLLLTSPGGFSTAVKITEMCNIRLCKTIVYCFQETWLTWKSAS